MPVTAVLAATAAAIAAGLLVPRRPKVRGGRTESDWFRDLRVTRSLGPAIVVALAAGALVVVVDGTALALTLVAVGTSAGVWRMVARARARKVAQRRADDVVEVCEALAGELKAGQPPLVALRHCVEVWPGLEPVATAGELGSDVPRALRQLALLPGASGLSEVASAWQVSQGAGGTMALALSRVADGSRQRRAARHMVASELASAMATARLVAVLPVAVLLMGTSLGGDPWGFLLRTPPGIACLASGLLLAYAGLAWIEKIAVSAVDA